MAMRRMVVDDFIYCVNVNLLYGRRGRMAERRKRLKRLKGRRGGEAEEAKCKRIFTWQSQTAST